LLLSDSFPVRISKGAVQTCTAGELSEFLYTLDQRRV
jgi:hypothetical protein